MHLFVLKHVDWKKGSFCRYRKALYFWSLGISLYLELFCFLSFITIVLRNLCSGTHRRNRKKLIKRSKTDNKCLAETLNNMQMHYSTEVHSLNVYLPSQSANQMKGISQATGCTREKNFLEKSVPKCNYITQRNGLWYFFFLRNCKLVKILECRGLLNAYIKPTVSFLPYL